MSESQSDTLTVKDAFKKADLSGKAVLAISTWFGAGMFPRAPGTFGTLCAVPVAIVMNHMGPLTSGLLLLIVVAAAALTAGLSLKLLGQQDPPEVVIDEVAGFLLTIFLVPSSWLTLLSGFVLFRVFDILKPFPIRRLERIEGGAGVVLDDILAGGYAALCIWIFLLVFY